MHKLDLNSTDSKNQPKTDSKKAPPTTLEKQSPVDETSSSVDNDTSSQTSALKTLNLDQTKDNMNKSSKAVLIFSIIAVVAGIATGFGGYKLRAQSTPKRIESVQQVPGQEIKAGDVFGVEDAKTFKDSAEGYLEAGGIDGEGSHSLLRPGGESQTVYLTSSVTDLDKVVGMEVKVWGETFKGQQAGWLMDVGRVEVINPEGEAPVEE